MKQNMCVTIDEEIHSWLKNKYDKLSRVVNKILWQAMQDDMRERAIKSGAQSVLPLMICPTCKTYGNTRYRNCACLASMEMVQ